MYVIIALSWLVDVERYGRTLISPLGVGMMAPDLPGTGAVMEMDSSGFAVIVTGPKGAPDPERARAAGRFDDIV